MMNKNTVAIIMRSKDEMPYVKASLVSLTRQSYRNFKLYNIDSGSSDGSFEAVCDVNHDPKAIFQIKPEDYVPGKVLNSMIAQTVEDVIVLLNSDAIPQSEDWLEKLIAPILRDDADATMSRQVARDDAYFIVDYDYKRAYDPKVVDKSDVFFSAVSCAFKKSLWTEVPFYVDGFSEDAYWCRECKDKGARFVYVPESVVEHSHNYTMSELYRRKFIEGEADVLIKGLKGGYLSQCYQLVREVIRDFIYTISVGAINTLPYNLVYRIMANKGYFDGVRSRLCSHAPTLSNEKFLDPKGLTVGKGCHSRKSEIDLCKSSKGGP